MMVKSDRINITGWASVAMAVLVHFAAITWMARGIIASVDANKMSIDLNRMEIRSLSDEQRARSKRVYSIDYIQDDVKEIKADIKDIKEALIK